MTTSTPPEPPSPGTAATGSGGLRVVTFGCRLNAFESEVMRHRAREAGLQNAVIINSCAVTAEAERQVRQAVRRARREHPEATIVVAGCAAQLSPERLRSMPEVDRVLGNREKLEAESYAPSCERDLLISDVMELRDVAPHMVDAFVERTRAFVQVQQGCDHRCTFCIIPFARGPSRSVPVDRVVEQVRRLVSAGHREVVLTGVDLTSWGSELPGRPPLGRLVRDLLGRAPELPRLRLSSLDPAELDPELLALFAEEPRLMPHAHLSVQAGDDLVLRRMGRRHSREDVLDAVSRLRAAREDIVLGADLIAGFPTETADMFSGTLDLVEEAGLALLHVFPYSERPGTPASRMPAVPRATRRRRAARLREAGRRVLAEHLERRVGGTERVLMESDSFGRTEQHLGTRVESPPGSVVSVRIVAVDGDVLRGEPSS